MKKRVLIVILVLVAFTLLIGCDSKDKIKTWEVIKSTGLYYRADADAEMLESLPVGTKVMDFMGNQNFSICEVDEGIEVCKVTVVETGQSGWVIKKWLE